MALTSGTRLGPYEILAPIGAGGMGEVYKAKDTRLDRAVAIKVLPEHLAESPERRERFEREAKAISQLNHPHICTLHDVGEQDGTDYLVMEYLEGETLAERLEKGALPLDQAVEYGIQIANGLDKAHRVGIVHRDLKPGNIIITESGVKLLDFGLARLVADEPVADASDAPTRQKDLTKERAIIGTPRYMAPEQLEGLQADARTDIFAFGAVLYEMVTGQRASESTSSAPPSLDRLIQTCLQKNPEKRWQNASDIARQLEWIGEPDAEPENEAPRKPWIMVATLVVGAIVGALLASGLADRAPANPSHRIEFQITLPPMDRILPRGLALSPDGRKLAYVGRRVAVDQLFLRSMDRVGPVLIEGTQGARFPFFSPDGQWIGFGDRTRLLKVSIAGGAPQVICELPDFFSGGTWGRDNTIVFGSLRSGLFQVSARGGDAEPLTVLEEGEARHFLPSFSPDQETVVFSVFSMDSSTQIVALRLDTGERRRIDEGDLARFSSTGHLLLARGPSLWTAPFDSRALGNVGDAVPVLEDVGIGAEGRFGGSAQFALAGNGTLAYTPGGAAAFREVIAWMDRDGRRLETFEMPGHAGSVSLSPDGSRLAVNLHEPLVGSRDIWLYELESGRVVPFITRPSDDLTPVWSHDGESVFFSSIDPRNQILFEKSTLSDTEAKVLLQSEQMKHVTSSSSDGRFLMYDLHRQNQQDLWVLSLDSEGDVEPVLQSEFDEDDGAFSPDGRWVAYASDRSGRYEVYVHPFRRPGGSVQVSIHGGKQPKWRGDGKELFFIAPDGALMAVPVDGASSFQVGTPEPLFDTGTSDPVARGIRWDVDPNGERFLLAVPASEDAATRIHVVLNWNENSRSAPR